MSIYLANNKRITARCIISLLFVLQTGCAAWDAQLVIPRKQAAQTPQHTHTAPAPTEKVSSKITRPPRITTLPGIARHTALSNADDLEGLTLPTEKIQINVDGLPLNRFVHFALGEVLKQSFQVDEQVAKRTDPVTLHITTPIKASRMLGLIQQALTAYDVAIVKTPDGLSVVPVNKLSHLPPAILSEKSRALIRLGRVMEIIPLNYARPGEAMSFARHFLQIGTLADVTANTRLNALVVIGDPQRVQQFKQAIKLIDKPSAKGKYIRLVRPVYWNIDELMDVVQKTLAAQGIDVATTNAASASGVRLIKIKKLNGMIISAPQKTWLNASLALIEKLDVPTAHGAEVKPYIYFVKNTRAEELGKIVNHVFSRTSATIKNKPTSLINRNSTPVSSLAVSTDKKKGKEKDPAKTAINNNQAVITDTRRNALIFVGTGKQYSVLLPIIRSLDILPRQILIEATVAEVTLDKTNKLGIEWQIDNINAAGAISSIGTAGGLGLATGGLTYTLINRAGTIRALISALAVEGKAKILSTPKVLAMDGEQARIQVGDQVLVVSGEVAGNNAAGNVATGVVRTFNYVDTGVILEVTPVINDGGVIQLKLHQEVSTPGPSNNNTPPISKRVVDTMLVAKSGQAILIGGLISHNKTLSESKVPLLGDIPYLGNLFKVQQTTDRTSELVILITPYLLNETDTVAQFTEEFKNIQW